MNGATVAFDIGSDRWPATAKVLEEAGELGQVLAKLIATGGQTDYFDGTDLQARIIEEAGDLRAALAFFEQHNLTPQERVKVATRAELNRRMFEDWHDGRTTAVR